MNSVIINLTLFFILISFNNSIVIFVGVSISLKKLRISKRQSHKVSYTFNITFSSQFFKSLNKKSAKSLKICNLSISIFWIKYPKHSVAFSFILLFPCENAVVNIFFI